MSRTLRLIAGAFGLVALVLPAKASDADYLAARDKAAAEVAALARQKGGEEGRRKADEEARAALERDLRALIGPVVLDDLPREGRITLETLDEGADDSHPLDGLLFAKGDDGPSLVVSTPGLVQAWLDRKAGEKDAALRLPADVDTAFGQDLFYTLAISGEAAFTASADLPLSRPAGAERIVAKLGGFAQDIGPNPNQNIVLTLVKGGRTFILTAPPKEKIGTIPACDALWDAAMKQSDELQQKARDLKEADDRLLDESTKSEEFGARTYTDCFRANAPQQPFFAGVVKEAQAWADRLAAQ